MKAESPQQARMMSAPFDAGSPALPRELFQFAPSEVPLSCLPMRCYDVALDGKRFYGVKRHTAQLPPVVTHIRIVQNWLEELKAKLPSR